MKSSVFTIRHKLQIFNSVIKNVSVYMMDYLIFLERSFKMFRHNKSMQHNISAFFGIRMGRHLYHYISIMIFNTTFPSRMVRSYPKSTKAFLRAKRMFIFFQSRRPLHVGIMTIFTFYFNWLVSHDSYNIISSTTCQGALL